MYDRNNRPARTQMSHYLRTGQVLPAEYFVNHKSNLEAHSEDDFLSYKSWTTQDFWNHYKGGNGRTIDLANVGLLGRFRRSRSVINIVNDFKNDQINLAIRHADNVYRRSRGNARDKRQFSDNDTAITDVTWDGNLFSVGNSTFFRSVRGTIEVNAPRNIVLLDGVMSFEIKDWFKDPFDIGVEVNDAKKYKIIAKWQQALSWSAGILQSLR